MFVKDIFDDARSITNYTDEALNFSRISDAVEVLSNKGDFDAQLSYVDIPITDYLITLPTNVDTPLRVNIDGNATFTRDRLYEFTLNGPGSNSPRSNWEWEDKGTVPYQGVFPATPTKLTALCGPLDNGKTMTIIGVASNITVNKETIILNASNPPVTIGVYSSIDYIHKDITNSGIGFFTSPDLGVLSGYFATETDPQYRRIRVNQKTGVAHILFRRKNLQVNSQEDFIAIRSKMGLILMLKALESYRNGDFDIGKKLETQAIQLANEEQKGHNAFIDLAASSENASIRNLSYNNKDCIIVSDIYDEACKIVGPVGEEHVYDKITEAISVLSNKAQWDSQRGYVDIVTDQYHYVTLPRYVDTIIEMNINTRPAEMKSKWFEFNQGGPGQGWIPWQSYMDAGTVVTSRDVLYTQRLALKPDRSEDLTVEFRVLGYYLGKRIFTAGVDGVNRDGFIVTPKMDGSIGSSQLVDRIERITKGKSQGFMRLLGRDISGMNEIQLGYYWPDETEPNYRRIKLPQGCETVRIMYRRRDSKISSLTDPIPLRSKTAVLNMLRSIELMNQGKVPEAQAMEDKATKLLLEEQSMKNQSEVPTIDFGGTWNNISRDFQPWA